MIKWYKQYKHLLTLEKRIEELEKCQVIAHSSILFLLEEGIKINEKLKEKEDYLNKLLASSEYKHMETLKRELGL